ncbi:MAG: GAF domain-containing protein [Acidimicrobiia bacterium]|nr:GAF domain-containing protein [Acidimicrobiia bacterium]
MGNSIYDEMSGLRPRKRSKRTARRQGAPESTSPGLEQSIPGLDAGPPPRATVAPAPAPASPDVVSQPAPRPEVGDSRLQASIDHLRSRSRLPRPAGVPDPAPADTRVASMPAPAPPPAEMPTEEPVEPTRRSERAERRLAKQQVKRWNKALKKAERAEKKKGRKRGMAPVAQPDRPVDPPPLEPPPTPSATPLTSRQERRAAAAESRSMALDNHRKAQEAIKTLKRVGAAQVADAKGRARNTEHLASVIPAGDWNRRELRRHIAAARKSTKAEARDLATQNALAISKMRAQAREYRKQGRRFSVSRSRRRQDVRSDSRVLSVRAGLAGSWIILATYAALAWDAGDLEQPGLVWSLAGLAGGLLVFSTVPWRRVSHRASFSVFATLWLLLLMIVLITTAEYHESLLGLFVAAVWLVLFAAVLLPPVAFGATSVAAIGTYVAAVSYSPLDMTTRDLMLRVVALLATGVIVGVTAHELRKQASATLRQLHDLDTQRETLARRESELLQLYEVSRTIGGGDLPKVLPELVARTAGYIGAKVGLVILHDPEAEALVALSPLWVAGQALEAEGYRFDPAGDSTAGTVFTSGKTYLRNTLTEADIAHDKLLADLGVERVAAVPLRVEGSTIGVLLVADKATDFTARDLSALELLSTPAGLVLNHLARYQQAQETGRRMSELAQLKSDFVSVVSHELRTPLTSVIGALSTLARPELAPENEVARSLLDSASTQANRLKTLIEDLLTVSKIDNQALPIRLEVGDVGDIIRQLVNRVPAWTEHVDLEIAPLLPPVAFDPDHLERVLTNLLDNARKYASESRIEVTARTVEDEVWVSVIDHGEGIPYEYEQTIFERFTQIERPDTRFKGGTGLGLNIVKDLTEAMHGRVWLEGTPGSGATFVVAFPRAEADARPTIEVGQGMLLVDPSRDRVEAPVNMDDLTGGSDGPVAQ